MTIIAIILCFLHTLSVEPSKIWCTITTKSNILESVIHICLYIFNFSSSNIGEFSRDVRLLAALQEEESDGERLLDAARKLASAFTNLLKAAQPGTAEVSLTYYN